MLTALAAFAAVALVVAGVGNASSSAKPPIVVMTLSPVNYNGPNFKNILEAARVYGQWIDANGGINGQQLKVITCDTRGDPNVLQGCARQAVSAHAVAVVGSYDNDPSSAIPILAAAKIPWFGGCCPVTTPEFSGSDSYPMGSGIGVIAGQAYLAGKLPQCTKIGLIDLAIPAEPFIQLLVKNSLMHSGKQLVKVVTIPAVVGGDLSPQVADITTGTNCVVAGLGEANWQAFLPALKQANPQGILFMGAQGNLDNKVIKSFGSFTDGWIACGIYPDESLPQWATYRAALKQYKADPTQDYNSLGGLGTWAGYVGFTNIAKTIKGKITNLSFLAAVQKTSHLTTGKLTPTINFTQEWTGLQGFNRLFNRYVTFDVAKNGKFGPYKNGAFYDLTGALEGK
jgi:ABC-type branched-subunit amino acid transport system substrate-binding protein